ncbi:MAG: hypothetical protein ACI9SC_002595, partial [Gammaproteobacteria bacterium]
EGVVAYCADKFSQAKFSLRVEITKMGIQFGQARNGN